MLFLYADWKNYYFGSLLMFGVESNGWEKCTGVKRLAWYSEVKLKVLSPSQ